MVNSGGGGTVSPNQAAHPFAVGPAGENPRLSISGCVRHVWRFRREDLDRVLMEPTVVPYAAVIYGLCGKGHPMTRRAKGTRSVPSSPTEDEKPGRSCGGTMESGALVASAQCRNSQLKAQRGKLPSRSGKLRQFQQLKHRKFVMYAS